MSRPHAVRRPAATLLLLFCLTSPALAGTISLRWDPVPDARGYRIHYGTRSGQYSEVVEVGNITQATLHGLEDCTRYFVAVKAYNWAGESAAFSNQVSGWPRPRIDSHKPAFAFQGAQYTLDIWGANFQTGAQLVWDESAIPTDLAGNPLVRIESARSISCKRIQALVTVEAPQRGFRPMQIGDLVLPVEVINPDSVFGSATAVIKIRFEQQRADINRSDAETRERVDGKDLTWLAFSHGSPEGSEYYNPDADLDGDGLVDGQDLALMAPFFGLCWTGTEWAEAACP